MVYLSIFSRSRLTPGTVSTRPSKEALIWNSLKRQAMTQAVVALERPTWSLMMTGVLMLVPIRVLQMMSKSVSWGAAELQTGTLQWTSPGYFSFRPSITWLRLLSSLTSSSDSFLLMSTTLSLPPLMLFLPYFLQEVELVLLDNVSGDVSKLSIFSNFVWWSSTDWNSIDIHIWLLSHVEPDYWAILGIVSSNNLLKGLLKTSS